MRRVLINHVISFLYFIVMFLGSKFFVINFHGALVFA
jgi:hypothetical protein